MAPGPAGQGGHLASELLVKSPAVFASGRGQIGCALWQHTRRSSKPTQDQTLDLARIHEQTLITELLPGCPGRQRASMIRQAGIFFAVAITPIEKTQRNARETVLHLRQLVMLSRRTVELAGCNLELGREIVERRAVAEALKTKERHYAQVLKQSERLQEQLRRLSRQVLSAQENERKEINRELHDIVAQSLTGINVRLAAFKKGASLDARDLDENIARTQRLVEESVNIVHRFARELRPAVLDDLGLISALHSFMKHFTKRTGIRTHLTAFTGVEELNIDRRTVLFRVAQEALTNVARHAQASRVRSQHPQIHSPKKGKDDGQQELSLKTREAQERLPLEPSDGQPGARDGRDYPLENAATHEGWEPPDAGMDKTSLNPAARKAAAQRLGLAHPRAL